MVLKKIHSDIASKFYKNKKNDKESANNIELNFKFWSIKTIF